MPNATAKLLTVHVAIIEHRHGFNHYAGATLDALYEKLAAYCRDNWDELPDDTPDAAPDDDRICVATYFGEDGHYSERLTIGSDTILIEAAEAVRDGR